MRGLMQNFLCRAGYEPCVKEARDQFKKWLNDEEPDKGNPSVSSKSSEQKQFINLFEKLIIEIFLIKLIRESHVLSITEKHY